MNCQSIGRNQRLRGLKLKQGLKLALLLAVGVWLVYQIKHSLHENKGYGKTVNIKLNEGHGSVILDRKGSLDGSLSGSEKVDFAVERGKNEDEGSRDGELDGKAKELSRENVPYQEKDNASNSIEELPREDYTGKGQDYPRASKLDHDNEMEQDPMKMPQNGTESSTDSDSDQQVLLDGVHGFQDENGVPELGNNRLIGPRDDDQEKIILQETTVTSDNRNHNLSWRW